jgi:hypothetical protein
MRLRRGRPYVSSPAADMLLSRSVEFWNVDGIRAVAHRKPKWLVGGGVDLDQSRPVN